MPNNYCTSSDSINIPIPHPIFLFWNPGVNKFFNIMCCGNKMLWIVANMMMPNYSQPKLSLLWRTSVICQHPFLYRSKNFLLHVIRHSRNIPIPHPIFLFWNPGVNKFFNIMCCGNKMLLIVANMMMPDYSQPKLSLLWRTSVICQHPFLYFKTFWNSSFHGNIMEEGFQ